MPLSKYPHAYEEETHNTIRQRFFKGYISCNTAFKRWNTQLATFIYELSFFSPRGLSGAPLFLQGTDNPLVVGLMIMNIEKQQVVLEDVETTTVTEGGIQRIENFLVVDRYRVGVAVQAHWLFNVPSRILGCTLGEFLIRDNLIVGL